MIRSLALLWLKRSNLDGTDIEDFDVPGKGIAAIDFDASKVYRHIAQTSENSRTIIRQNLDGTGEEELVVGGALTDLALDLPGGKLYWTEGNSTANIKRANLDGTQVDTLFSLSTRLNDLQRIAIDPQERKMYWVNRGNDEEIWQAGLDGVLGDDGGLRFFLLSSPFLQGLNEFALSYERPEATGIVSRESSITNVLSQPYPNPFSSSIAVEVYSEHSGEVRLEIFDVLGRHRATLYEGSLAAGLHRFNWNANTLAPGLYVLRLITNENVYSHRVMKVK